MGRKIPGKKHRTVKDPEVQRHRRYAEIKNKINNPPKNVDEQEMPKSVLRIIELKEKAKQQLLNQKMQQRNKKRKSKNDRFDVKRALGNELKMPGMDRPDQYIPEIKQGPSEPVYQFTRRVQHVCNDLIRERKFEEKFGVEIKRDDTGHITEVKQLKNEKKSKKPKLSEKRKNRKLTKIKNQEPIKDFPKQDRVEFGDIVHQPPTKLTTPGKKSQNAVLTNRKPGKGELLLKSMLPEKKLEKQRQEERRKLVVEAFRKLKKKNM